jgi:hypothetical protein
VTDAGDWRDYRDDSRPQEEPDFDAIAEWERQEHEDQAHGGKPCDCPPGEPLNPEPPGGYSDEPPF